MVTDQSWTPVDIFNVMYPKNDIIGKVLACCSMMPIFISIGFVTLIMFKRDLFTAFEFLGLLLNELLNYALKNYLRYSRPFVPNRPPVPTYGMPSNHAQFMGYFCAFSTLFLLIRLKQHSLNKWMRFILFSICILVTTVTCYSRIYLVYHTLAQVVAGLALGIGFGILWFFTVHRICTPFFPRICDSFIGNLFLIQDFTPISNLLLFEYNNAKKACRYKNDDCPTGHLIPNQREAVYKDNGRVDRSRDSSHQD